MIVQFSREENIFRKECRCEERKMNYSEHDNVVNPHSKFLLDQSHGVGRFREAAMGNIMFEKSDNRLKILLL